MGKKEKSVLDGIETKEDPEYKRVFHDKNQCEDSGPLPGQEKQEKMSIVGCCPDCNAPIYGPRTVALESGNVLIRRSCDCHPLHKGKTIQDTMETK